jgi:hypothetical protein
MLLPDHLLPLRRGRNITADERRITPSDHLLPNLLHTLVATPQFRCSRLQGTSTTGRRALIARTRINRCVFSAFLNPPEPPKTHTQ